MASKREHGEAEGVLHARAPVAIELTAKDPEGVGGGLVAIPAKPGVEQVDAERPQPIGDIQVLDVGLPLARHQPECADSQVAVRIDHHHRALLAARVHQVVYQAQQQARLAPTRLGYCQQVPAEQLGWQMDWNGVSLMGGDANAAAGATWARGHGAP